MRPNNIALSIALALMIALAAPLALATSFIAECGDSEYRDSRSDVVFHGTVKEFDNKGVMNPHGETVFVIDAVQKGDLKVGQEFILTQPGRTGSGIPAITLEWVEGEQYLIQASEAGEDAHDYDGAIDAGDYQLVCGVMGRTAIMESPVIDLSDDVVECLEHEERDGMVVCTRTSADEQVCAQVVTRAQNPKTGEFQDFPTPCDVPEGWDTILPVEPDGGIGDGAAPPGEVCAQVITYAENPESNAVMQFPTPCDVPEGWQVVDEPVPVEPDGGIGDGAGPIPEPGFWQSFTGWFKSLF